MNCKTALIAVREGEPVTDSFMRKYILDHNLCVEDGPLLILTAFGRRFLRLYGEA